MENGSEVSEWEKRENENKDRQNVAECVYVFGCVRACVGVCVVCSFQGGDEGQTERVYVCSECVLQFERESMCRFVSTEHANVVKARKPPTTIARYKKLETHRLQN